MSACEKCWADASMRSMHNGRSVADNYRDLIIEREDTPCSAEQQKFAAGIVCEEVIDARSDETGAEQEKL